MDKLNEAKAFHDQLANRYHPNTYSFHGDGLDKENGRTWGRVSWGAKHVVDIARRDRLENPARVYAEPRLNAADLLALRVSSDDGQGRLESASGGQAVDFQISEGDSPGDGTVPVASGAAAAHFGGKTAYHVNLDDVGHEGAYKNPTARALTLHAILSIAQTVEIKE